MGSVRERQHWDADHSRLGEDAHREMRRMSALIKRGLIVLVPGLAGVFGTGLYGAANHAAMPSNIWEVVVGISLSLTLAGVSVFIFGALGFFRVRSATGKHVGLTRRQARDLDLSSAEAFEASVARAKRESSRGG